MPKSKRNKAEKVTEDDTRSQISEPVAKRQKKKKRQNRVSSDEDEPVYDEDALLREEMRDFLVDEDEHEDEARSNKTEASNSDEGELSDEDFELLNENIGKRPAGRVQISDDEDDEEVRNRIGNDLFDPDADGRSACAENGGFQSGSDQSESEFLGVDHAKGKSGRRVSVVDQDYLDDARDIFGSENSYDVDDEQERNVLGAEKIAEAKVKGKRTSLWNLIEPSELEKSFANDVDKKIIFADIPERFQVRKVPVTQADDRELDLEAAWVFEYAFNANPMSRQDVTSISKLPGPDSQSLNQREKLAQNQVRVAIEFIRNEYLEPPFIASYRKEEIGTLGLSDLWRIYQYDEKWCRLEQNKGKLLGLLNRLKEYIASENGRQLRPVTESDLNEVVGIQMTEELSDLYANYQLYYGSEMGRLREWEPKVGKNPNTIVGSQFKSCNRNDRYLMCVNSGLSGMVEFFGLTSKEFAENFAVSKKHEVRQDPREPVEVANAFVCSNFKSPEDVLAGGIYLLALQISREPAVRKKLREIFRNRLKLTVYPTKKGIHEIDENHPLWGKHYIKDKPVKDLSFAEYLHYSKAKDNGLIEIKLHPDAEHEVDSGNTMFDCLVRERIFHRDQFYYVVEEWNKLRTEVIRVCVNDILLPVFSKEAHYKLLEEARDCVLKKCSAVLRAKLSIAAYKPFFSYTKEDQLNDEGSRVMSVTYSSDRDEASFALVVDEDGVVLDYIRLARLHMHIFSKRGDEAELKKKDMGSLRKLVLDRQPHVIAIAAENFEALQILRDVKRMVKSLMDEGQLQNEIPVEITDNDAAKVYMKARNSRLEFPSYPPLLRQAVSLARTIIDPLVEICRLCNNDDDILFMNFDPLQSEIPKSSLLQALQIECINKVNEAGVDVNRCLQFPHMSSLFQFVSGLGPRKAAYFLKLLQQNDNLLESRVRLVDMFDMGLKVFLNAAAFILIDTVQVSKRTDAYVEILDGSRVHPESYDWARKIAGDALDIEGDDATEALEQISKYPERLHALDLEFFAAELCSQGSSNKSVTLLNIRDELLNPFKDFREERRAPEAKELFELLARDDVYPEGKLVKGRVLRVVYRKPDKGEVLIPLLNNQKNSWECAYCKTAGFAGTFEASEHRKKGLCLGIPIGVLIALENGTVGVVAHKNISDTPDSFRHPSERLVPGQSQMFRVISFNSERVRYELSCRSSDLHKITALPDDPYFDEFRFKQDEYQKNKLVSSTLATPRFLARGVTHPSFKNCSYKEAESMLSGMDQGDAIIRPSSKSPDLLTVTWKVAENIFHHVNIQESHKEVARSIGKVLRIGNETFDDLDEIIARHIDPMASFARNVMSQRKYFLPNVSSEDVKKVELYLIGEKRKMPSRIPYVITASRKHPASFVLSYIVQQRLRHEFLSVQAQGIKFRNHIFSSTDELINWFKVNYMHFPEGNQGN